MPTDFRATFALGAAGLGLAAAAFFFGAAFAALALAAAVVPVTA
jgi:hypothetical protein